MHKVRVGYRDFTLSDFPKGFGERLDGETDFTTQTIHVHGDLLPQTKAATILHELLHVIYDEYGIAVGDSEERVVSAFTNGLSQIIRDNPGIIVDMIQGLKN